MCILRQDGVGKTAKKDFLEYQQYLHWELAKSRCSLIGRWHRGQGGISHVSKSEFGVAAVEGWGKMKRGP